MEKIVFFIWALATSLCIANQSEAGTVCVNFGANDYSTNDPTQITQPVADKIRDQFIKQVKQQTNEDSHLKTENICNNADFALNGQFKKIDIAVKERLTFTGKQQKRLYDIEIEATLTNKSGAVLASITEDKDNRELGDILESLAHKTVEGINIDATR